jgi:hypothetical protein
VNTGWAQGIGENPNAYSAFLTFLDMGPTRSLRKLAAETRIPFGNLARWSSKYNWVARALSFDANLTATAEVLEESDLRKAVNDGLWGIVDAGLIDLAAGREGNRSASELAAILSNALKTDETPSNPKTATHDDGPFDVTRLTADEETWVRQVNAACAVTAEPETDLRVAHLKEKRTQLYQAILHALRGGTALSHREIGKLGVAARSVEKQLSELAKPERHDTHDYASLSLDELQRLDHLDQKGRGTLKEELRIYCGGVGASFSHDLARPLRSDVLENWARLRDVRFELIDSSGNARTISVDELRAMCEAA